MDYTHYFYRKDKEVSEDIFRKIVSDFHILLPVFREIGIKLAGGRGEGSPEVSIDGIIFNGSSSCGHPKNSEIVIPRPSKIAKGVTRATEDVVSGTWFTGAVIDKRVCDGDCSYEIFYFPRKLSNDHIPFPKVSYLDKQGKEGFNKRADWYFSFCKTAYRPYDLAVNCVLIIAKHYLGRNLLVYSDGSLEHWTDGMLLCQDKLGYGAGFRLDEEGDDI